MPISIALGRRSEADDGPGLGVGRRELGDGLDEGGDVLVVAVETMLVFRDQLRKTTVFDDQLAQAVEDTHDGDVYLYGALAVEDRGKHGHAQAGEGVGAFSQAHLDARIGSPKSGFPISHLFWGKLDQEVVRETFWMAFDRPVDDSGFNIVELC